MKCVALVDRWQMPAWQHACIEGLRDGNAVEVCAPHEDASGAVADGACDLVLDLRADGDADAPAYAGAAYWTFCDGDGRRLGERPAAPEIAAGAPSFSLELRGRDADGAWMALRSGTFKSLYSYARSMEIALGECARWPAIALRVQAALGRLSGTPRPAPQASCAPPAPASLALRDARAYAAHCWQHLFVDARWRVGLIHASPERFLERAYRPQIEWLRTAAPDFLADPFVVQLGGGRYVMGERVDPKNGTGFITCLEVDERGAVLAERQVMRPSTHRSYPYVFRDAGSWYLVPESAQENCVALYRGVEVPYTWERVATLLDGVDACDATIVRHGDLWWLFCTHASRDASLNLFAYYARELIGPWHAHTANPVKTDVGSARPAGTPFVVDGALYRPAQDCTRAYGDAIAFNRIVTLTEHEFCEETVATFRADGAGSASQGVHTISCGDGVMAIDSKTVVLASPRVIGRRLGRLAARAAGAFA